MRKGQRTKLMVEIKIQTAKEGTFYHILWFLFISCPLDGFATFGPLHLLATLAQYSVSQLTPFPLLTSNCRHALSLILHPLTSLLTFLLSEVPSFPFLSFPAVSAEGFPNQSCSLTTHSHPHPITYPPGAHRMSRSESSTL